MIEKDRVAIIIGAMKCGTSSLFDYLAEHEAVAPSRVKEPEFFSEGQSHRLDVPAYRDLWPDYDPGVHRVALEASTGYTKFPNETGVPERMRDYGLSPKLVYIVRNPFDRIESHFQHVRHLPFERDMIDEHVLDTSNYFLQIERYLRVFPERNVLLVDFDDLVARPGPTVGEVCRFLEIDPPATPPVPRKSNGTRYTRKLRRRFETSRAGFLAPLVPGRVFDAADCLLERIRPEAKRVLSEAERGLIHDRLKGGMRRLDAAFGVPTAKWGF